MFLAIDIGNSTIAFSIYRDGEWTNTFRYESKEGQPLIYYINGFNEVLLEWGILPAQITDAAMSSVVPHLNDTIVQAAQAVTGIDPHIIGPDDFYKLDMYVPKKYEIGSDLVCNSYATLQNYKKDSLIIDFGTALTFTVVTVANGIEGVTIAPGLKTAMQSLSGNTAQLPEVWLTWPEKALGHDTQEAIRSGVLIGYHGLIKELKQRILSEYPSVQHVVGTGGLVQTIQPIADAFDVINKQLTLEGVRYVANAYASL